MMYSSSLLQRDVVEHLRSVDENAIKNFALELRDECQKYDFRVNEVLCDYDNINLIIDEYESNRPKKWLEVIKAMFIHYNTCSREWLFKFDVIFQIFTNWVTNGKRTPFHCSLVETVHNLSKSRQLIGILNRAGLCASYDEMKRIDTSLAMHTVELAGTHRCPVSEKVNSEDIIQGAMDTFDHNENIKSGKDTSHDTVLVIFQNTRKNDGKVSRSIDKDLPTFQTRERKLPDILPCQQLCTANVRKGTAKIPEGFSPTKYIAEKSSSNVLDSDYFLWCLGRHGNYQDANYPSFQATQSALLDVNQFNNTTVCFIPILPYVATDIDSIFTTVINFQDVLKQRQAKSGALWCDEGVYQIAKEIQLLKPELFDKIFLGLGGFHTEKIIISCLGKYLKDIGIDIAQVESGIFGENFVKNSVMNGGHYVRGKEAMNLIAEAISVLQFESFNEECEEDIQSFLDTIDDMRSPSSQDASNFKSSWKACQSTSDILMCKYNAFKSTNQVEQNQNCQYWNIFIDQLHPFLRDMTHSFRAANWKLHISALRRAIPMFFAFGRSNYSRWAPLYLEDCLDLQRKFPEIYKTYLNGGFVMYYSSNRKGSAVPLDQALEKSYNKPAKVAGGIIGMTRQKEAVAQWNIIKHHTDSYVTIMKQWSGPCGDDNGEDEYSLHHEFNPSSTKEGILKVNELLNYIRSIRNPFDGGQQLRNIVTGEELEGHITEMLLSSVQSGEKGYQEYVKTRLDEKSKQLHDTIPTFRCKVTHRKEQAYDVNKETIDAIKYIEYARVRKYDINELLKYEITPTSFFLTSSGFLRKSDKSQLSRELQSRLPETPTSNIIPDNDIVVVDFMAFARRVPIKKIKIATFGEFANNLWKIIMATAKESKRIHIVFDVYTKNSIKQAERENEGVLEKC